MGQIVEPLSTAQSVLLYYTTAAKRRTEEGEHVLCETELDIFPLSFKVTSMVSVGDSHGKGSLAVDSSKETGYVGDGFEQNPDLGLSLFPGPCLFLGLCHAPCHGLSCSEMVLLGKLFFDLLESS